MRTFIEIAAALASVSAFAFDSDSWLAQRAFMGHEAARLRAAYAQFSARAVDPAQSLSIPVETYENGSVKTGIAAERAQVFVKEGFVWGEGVKVRQYGRDGAEESGVDAERCVIDRSTRSGWVEGAAKGFFRGEAELEGEGVYFSAAEGYLATYSNTVLKAQGKVLRAVRADYDRDSGVAMFDGGVVLSGEEKGRPFELSAGSAFAFLDGTNSLRRIVALGGVVVSSESRSGRCESAVYTRRDSRVVMHGAQDAPARLVDGGDRRREIEGSRITFWIDAEQVEVENSSITVDTKGMKLPKGPGL